VFYLAKKQAPHNQNSSFSKVDEYIYIRTVHSCISCSFVASRITKMFSLRADSCCCCFSFSSDSFSPGTSLAKTAKRGRREKASGETSLHKQPDILVIAVRGHMLWWMQLVHLQHSSVYLASRTWTYASCCFHLRGAEHV